MTPACGLLAMCACVSLTACGNTTPTNPLHVHADAVQLTALGASGGGYYDVAGLPAQFAFTATQTPQGDVSGRFHVFVDEGGGLAIDVAGDVICMSEDPVNHHAWIGALVSTNRSTDPDFQTDINQPGDDVWFRVLDGGEGSGSVDRTTFIGFKGAAGIQTSPQYCAARLWPDNNARTWPVTSGNISVRP